MITIILTSAGLTACSGGFQGDNSAQALRPPVTADPAAAYDQRMLTEQLQQSQPPSQGLETSTERESFLRDLTEKEPSHNEDQLAQEAEAQFQKKLEKIEGAKSQSPSAAVSAGGAAPSVPEAPAQATKAVDVKTSKAPAKVPATKPKAPPATKNDSAKVVDFCTNLNVVSGGGVADLSGYYNRDSKLPTELPPAAPDGLSSDAKKNKFICVLLPVAIRMEEEVYKQRLEILRLQSKQTKSGSLSSADETWLRDMNVAYGLDAEAGTAELLSRVDVIPLPLLLAQAALESGWGNSKVSRELKNLFGMHASGGQTCRRSQANPNVCIRQFNTLAESVSAYIRLLNVGGAYEKFRQARAQLRVSGKPLDSEKLLLSMSNYNENPGKYVRDVRDIMSRYNKLTQFVFTEAEVQPTPRSESSE